MAYQSGAIFHKRFVVNKMHAIELDPRHFMAIASTNERVQSGEWPTDAHG